MTITITSRTSPPTILPLIIRINLILPEEREKEREGGRERGREGGREGGRERILWRIHVHILLLC